MLTAGCSSQQRQQQLERVARDWCLTIRASQIVPVYPLTEDLRPGDAFLVTRTAQQQHTDYRKRGFLPFDHHLGRIAGFDYATYYRGSYGIDGRTNTPDHWQFPDPPPAELGDIDDDGDGKPDRHVYPTNWPQAPRAAFPTYTFNVTSGGGIQAALPIQGVPVGLSLIGADKATGSVAIQDTYTFGLPEEQMIQSVLGWSSRPLTRVILADAYHQNRDRTVYVRVVSRVYLTGRVSVSLTNTGSGSAGVDVNQRQSFSIPDLTERNAFEAHQANIAALNAELAQSEIPGQPGASFRIAWANDRSIAMDEAFDRPLVIGYLGFDFPIMDGGVLGLPVATIQRLESSTDQPPLASESLLRQTINNLPTEARDEILSHAAQQMGTDFYRHFANNLQDPDIDVPVAFDIARTDTLPDDARQANIFLGRLNQTMLTVWLGHSNE